MKSAWVNGSFDSWISPHDEGLLLGHGVFETMGVFGAGLPLLDRHLRRLERGASVLGIRFVPPADLVDSALELLRREPQDDVVRLTLTAGVDDRPTWMMTTRRRVGLDRPLLLRVSETIRHTSDPLAHIKSTSYAFYSLMRRRAEARGSDDSLLLGEDDRILETTTGNVFFWRAGQLHTPAIDGGLLPGVGREALLASLESMGVNVGQSNYSLADLGSSDGIFVTNAVYGPRPATLVADGAAELDPVVVEAWRRAIL